MKSVELLEEENESLRKEVHELSIKRDNLLVRTIEPSLTSTGQTNTISGNYTDLSP